MVSNNYEIVSASTLKDCTVPGKKECLVECYLPCRYCMHIFETFDFVYVCMYVILHQSFCLFVFETGSYYVVQADLELAV